MKIFQQLERIVKMKRFKNVILYLEEPRRDDAAVFRAANLAANNSGVLKVVSCMSQPPKQLISRLRSDFKVDVESLIRSEKIKRLNRIKSRYDKLVPVETKLLIGTAFIEIVKEVLRENHDLLIVNAENERNIREKLLGSNEMHLLRKCPCPVWVLNTRDNNTFGRILVAIDSSSKNEETENFNQKLLELSTSLAKIESAEHHVIHCWEAYGESMLRSREARGSGEDVDDYVNKMKNLARKNLYECLSPFDIKSESDRVHLIKGNPELAITNFIVNNDIDLIVMGTLARTGISGLLIGNTAERILNGVECSLLAVKPDGFSSPITV